MKTMFIEILFERSALRIAALHLSGLFLVILAICAAGCGGDQVQEGSAAMEATVYAVEAPAQSAQMVEDLLRARADLGLIPLLTDTYGSFSIDEAYRVQERLAERLANLHGEVVGYKIGYAAAEDFERLGIDGPAYGPLFASYEVENGGTLESDAFNLFHIENEVAFIIDRRIDEPLSDVEGLKPYVRSVHAGFDMADRVYEPGAAQTIPDFIANGGGARAFALGPAHDPGSTSVDELILTIDRADERIYEGPATAAMGSPWNVLLFLANDLIKRGHALEAGDIVLSGKVAPVFTTEGDAADGSYVGEAGPLGTVSVTVR